MPKSKRSKLFHLTKTDKKGKEAKENLLKQVQECIDVFQYVYVFRTENMRNVYMKDVRNKWNGSRFFLGRNRIMARALGTSEEDEYKPGLSKLAKKLTGDVGLLFTNESPEVVKDYFESYSETDYARGGATATTTVTIPAGEVMRGEDDKFPHNMESQLRSLGMPTMLVNGVVTLRSDYTICKEGDILTPEQAQLLKHFYIQMAEFRISMLHYWYNDTFYETC